MKFEQIPQALDKDGAIEINNGEVIIKKKLKAVIGGINIYKIMVDFVSDQTKEQTDKTDQSKEQTDQSKEQTEPLYFNTLDELDDWSIVNSEKNIRRCLICDSLPIAMEQFANDIEPGYFYDEEMNTYYCCKACRNKWFNDVYGEDNYKFEDNEFMGVNTYVRKNRDSEWEPYRIRFILPYNM